MKRLRRTEESDYVTCCIIMPKMADAQTGEEPFLPVSLTNLFYVFFLFLHLLSQQCTVLQNGSPPAVDAQRRTRQQHGDRTGVKVGELDPS